MVPVSLNCTHFWTMNYYFNQLVVTNAPVVMSRWSEMQAMNVLQFKRNHVGLRCTLLAWVKFFSIAIFLRNWLVAQLCNCSPVYVLKRTVWYSNKMDIRASCLLTPSRFPLIFLHMQMNASLFWVSWFISSKAIVGETREKSGVKMKLTFRIFLLFFAQVFCEDFYGKYEYDISFAWVWYNTKLDCQKFIFK